MSIHTSMLTNNATASRMSILNFLKSARVTTTSEISEKMNISWNTAEKRLLELVIDQKVEKIKKVGVNLWVLR